MCTTDVGKVAQLLEAELRKVDGGRPASSTVSEAKKKMAAAVQWASETSGVSLASAKTAIKEDSGGSRMQPPGWQKAANNESNFASVEGVHGLGHAKGTDPVVQAMDLLRTLRPASTTALAWNSEVQLCKTAQR
jgi:hypothetical protein